MCLTISEYARNNIIDAATHNAILMILQAQTIPILISFTIKIARMFGYSIVE
jgi:hypothetical protein